MAEGGGDPYDFRNFEEALDEVVSVPPEQEQCYKFVIFDLETTGLGCSSHIIQIGARCDSKVFNTYIWPKRVAIPPKVTEKTGLCLSADGTEFLVDGAPTDNVLEIRPALQGFFDFLREVKGQPGGPVIVLTAHNCKLFDSKVLISTLLRLDMVDDLSILVAGFADTLPVYRAHYPQFENHKQSTLVKRLLPDVQFRAHNASEDVRALELLVTKLEKDKPGVLITSTFTVRYILACLRYKKELDTSTHTFNAMVRQKYVTKYMVEQLGKAGFTQPFLEHIFREQGKKALFTELTQRGANGKQKITTKGANIVVEGFRKYCEQHDN